MIELCATKIEGSISEGMIKRSGEYLPPSFFRRALEKEGTFAGRQRFMGLLLLWRMINRRQDSEGVKGETLEIAEHEGGKPYISGMPHIEFSISHKGDLVVCALNRCGAGEVASPIGVDVEVIPDDERRISAIARRFFSSDENAFIERSEDRCEAFARIWTRKESLLKLRGEGIGRISSVNALQPAGLTFFEYRTFIEGDRYLISLCCCEDLICFDELEFISFSE
ncbi:MAG: 4'-phosphopantetheinyl transferase superfamily protein [Clostridiales bacterium]|nr:4'-phosphopantetheinyl transferase superfamily protein [Clostridiales bacterium]